MLCVAPVISKSWAICPVCYPSGVLPLEKNIWLMGVQRVKSAIQITLFHLIVNSGHFHFVSCIVDLFFSFLQECVFKKISDKTGLRVFWSGPLRIYNCHSCCRRWYFTFNGAECSAPAAIDGVVYMVHGNSAKKDLHRVRQIEGVCQKVHKGTVRVGFWVGNCAHGRSADAFTGWYSVSRIYVDEIPPPQA